MKKENSLLKKTLFFLLIVFVSIIVIYSYLAFKYENKNPIMQSVLFGITLIIIGLVTLNYFNKIIIKPLKSLSNITENFTQGNYQFDKSNKATGEIGRIYENIGFLSENISKASQFADLIGQNKLDVEFKSLGNNDILGNSLNVMRNNLMNVADKEAKRNWVNSGLAMFSDILRDTENIDVFYNNVLSNLIRYVHANQGYLYIINEDDKPYPFMEIKAVYAYGKQKYLEEKIEIKYKQGLVGQCWFDNEPLFFTEIPKDYVKITSGIGEATPRCIFLCPLIVNEKVVGVIEIATFENLESHKTEFINKIAETIAIAVSNVKTNERTKILLELSQQQTEEMRAQEEEMRQNMEEMQATQEEMERVQIQLNNEKQRIEDEFEAQLNIINNIAIVSKTDLKGNITYVNEQFLKWSKYSKDEVMGKNHRILKSGDQDDQIFVDMWKIISSGKVFRGEIKNKAKDGSFYWVDAIIAPVLDIDGKPKEYIAQRFVINDKKEKEEQMQSLIEETKAQEEEIRQNLEETQAIQDLMEKNQLEIEAQNNIINSIAIVSKTDLQGNITFVNEEFLKWSKYTKEEVIGKNHRILKSGDQDDQIFVEMWKTISSGNIFRGEIKNKAKDGSFYWVDAIIAPVLDSKGKPKEYIAQRFVINEQKEREEKLNELLGKSGK